MGFAKLGALSVLAATLCCGPALAQQAYQPYVLNEKKIASPSAADSQFISAFVSETYNSNVAGSDAALAASRGLTLSDEITQIGVNGTAIQTLGRQRFFFNGNFDYEWYARDRVFDAAQFAFLAGDTLSFGQCSATLFGDYYGGHSDVPIFPTVAVSNIRSTGAVGLSAGCNRPYGLNPNVAVSERWNNNSAAVYNNANNRVLTVSGGLDFTTPTLGSLGLYGEYDNIHYNNSFVFVNGMFFQDNFDVFTGGLKYSKQLTPNLGGQAFITYTTTTSPAQNANNFSGLTYAFTAYYTVAPRLFASAYVTREVLPSDIPYATYVVAEDYHLVGNYQASSRMRLQLEGHIDNYDYRQTTTLALPPGININHQTSYQIQANLLIMFSNFASVEAYVGERRRDSSFGPLDYWATIVGLKLHANFGH